MKALYPGDEGVLVQYVQLALKRAGYPLETDGIFGEMTCAALRAFSGNEGACEVTETQWRRLLPYLKGYTVHEVQAGDTFWKLASEYRSAIWRLMVANPTVNPLNLQVGAMIVVPFDFALVPEDVAYTSYLTEYILEGLLVRYPFLKLRQIGTSVMGRDLSVLTVGEGKRQVFYNAAFHANEWITTPVLLKFAEEYAASYATGQNLYGVRPSWLYYGFTLSLMPLVNPDGVDLVNGLLEDEGYYERARRIAESYPQIPFPSGWKANIEGVDLNLQFPAGWENAKEIKYAQGFTSPAPRDYVGAAPLTAPESLAVYEYTKQNDFQLILAYHTQGEVIYWKYLDYEPEGSYRIAQYLGDVSGYAVEVTPGASGYAGYKDWFIQDYNRPGYTVEVGRGVNPLPMEQFPQIYQANEGILTGAMTQLV